MNLRRTALALAPATALIALMTSAPAQAQTRTVHDGRHDVVGDRDSQENPTTLRPQRREGDVRWTRVSHGPGAVRVVQHYAQLSRVRSAYAAHFFAFRTDEGRRAELDLVVDGTKRDWQGQAQWEVRGQQAARCPGLRTRIDYAADTVRVTVPRSCLSGPRWVRVGSGAGVFDRGLLYADDARLTGRVGDDLTFSRRLRRG